MGTFWNHSPIYAFLESFFGYWFFKYAKAQRFYLLKYLWVPCHLKSMHINDHTQIQTHPHPFLSQCAGTSRGWNSKAKTIWPFFWSPSTLPCFLSSRSSVFCHLSKQTQTLCFLPLWQHCCSLITNKNGNKKVCFCSKNSLTWKCHEGMIWIIFKIG